MRDHDIEDGLIDLGAVTIETRGTVEDEQIDSFNDLRPAAGLDLEG